MCCSLTLYHTVGLVQWNDAIYDNDYHSKMLIVLLKIMKQAQILCIAVKVMLCHVVFKKDE